MIIIVGRCITYVAINIFLVSSFQTFQNYQFISPLSWIKSLLLSIINNYPRMKRESPALMDDIEATSNKRNGVMSGGKEEER